MSPGGFFLHSAWEPWEGPGGAQEGRAEGFQMDLRGIERAALCLTQASTLEQHVSGLNGELFSDDHYGNGRVTNK